MFYLEHFTVSELYFISVHNSTPHLSGYDYIYVLVLISMHVKAGSEYKKMYYFEYTCARSAS